MLNYIWSGLIIGRLLFARTVDTQELVENRFPKLRIIVQAAHDFAETAAGKSPRMSLPSATQRFLTGTLPVLCRGNRPAPG